MHDIVEVDQEGTVNAERVGTRTRPVIHILDFSLPSDRHPHIIHISCVPSSRVPELCSTDFTVKTASNCVPVAKIFCFVWFFLLSLFHDCCQQLSTAKH